MIDFVIKFSVSRDQQELSAEWNINKKKVILDGHIDISEGTLKELPVVRINKYHRKKLAKINLRIDKKSKKIVPVRSTSVKSDNNISNLTME